MTPALYPALKSNIWVAFHPGHFAERKPFGKSTGWRSKAPQGGWVIVPASLCQRPVFCSDFWENRLPPQSRTRPQHCVSFPRRCTDAIRLAGGAHNPSQGLTRGVTVSGCNAQRRQVVIGRGRPGKNYRLISGFLDFSGVLILTQTMLYDYGVVEFSYHLFCQAELLKHFWRFILPRNRPTEA